jgi:pimeloyl-ACP methyl ester carboxylesterase
MLTTLSLLCALLAPDAPTVKSLSEQVAPRPTDGRWVRRPDQKRAVVLIHGFHFHLREESARKAELRPWQLPNSTLVKELARDADVFAFAYGQNASLKTIAAQPTLGEMVARLRRLGYREVVLVGHSAGGLLARQFVEDHPDAGVTKVVQVCSPNEGSPLADVQVAEAQRAFLESLTAAARRRSLKERADVRIPKDVQFVCVVASKDGTRTTDGVVPCASQWSADLRDQGVPARLLTAGHREAVRGSQGAKLVAKLVQEEQPRWKPEQVRAALKEIFGP